MLDYAVKCEACDETHDAVSITVFNNRF